MRLVFRRDEKQNSMGSNLNYIVNRNSVCLGHNKLPIMDTRGTWTILLCE